MLTKLKPLPYQERALKKCEGLTSFGFPMPTGAGKTKTAIDAMHHPSRDIDSVVVVTTPGALYQWEDEIKANSPWPGPITIADGNPAERLARFENFLYQLKTTRAHAVAERSPVSWFIITHQTFRLSWPQFDALLSHGYKDFRPTAIVLDESHKIKDPKALITKCLLSARSYFRTRCCLTATLVTEREQEFFTQTLFLDDGERFGRGYWGFMRKFFNPDERGWKWSLKHRAAQAIRSRLETIWFGASEREVFKEMPAASYTVVRVPMNANQAAAYRGVKNDWQNAAQPLKWILQRIVAQQVIANGFAVYTKDNGKRYRLDYGTRKPQVLFDWLEENYPAEPAVIFCRFLYDIERLHAEAINRGLSFQQINGDVPALDRRSIVKGMAAGKPQILAIQSRCAESIDGLQRICRLFLFYSNHHSLSIRIQAEGRGFRQGQRQAVRYVDFVTKETIEEDILRAFRNKTDVIRMLNPKALGRLRYGKA